jgi:CHAD domain-containing protein
VTSPAAPKRASAPAATVFRRALAHLADTIEASRLAAIDGVDADALHDLRVAVRRTRSILAEAKGVLPKDVRRFHRERFEWLGQRTGPARDLDVLLAAWDDHVARLDDADRSSLERVRLELSARRIGAHVELATVLQGQDYRDLLDGWRSWLADPRDPGRRATAAGVVVSERVARAHERLVRDGRAITAASPAERLHDLRKDAKKLRYLLECLGSVFPRAERKAFVAQLKDLQDNLGAHQDAEVHLAQVRELTHDLHGRSIEDEDAVRALGHLRDHLERRRAMERADFADRFASFDRASNAKVLHRMLRGARKAARG